MSRVVITATGEAFEKRFRTALAERLNGGLARWKGPIGMPQDFVDEVSKTDPEVVVLGPELEIDRALLLADEFGRSQPQISVLLVADPSPALWERALRAGVKDIIPLNAGSMDVQQQVERALLAAERLRSRYTTTTVSTGSLNGATRRVITVLGPKGGTGRTTLATNLAVALADAHPRDVVLVDLDLQFGDVTSALRLRPAHSIADVAGSVDQLDLTTLKVHLEHHESGLYVLCAPGHPAEGDDVTGEHIQRILELLRLEFTYIVIDTPAGLTEPTLAAIDLSTDLVLVSSTEVPNVRDMRKAVDTLDQLGVREPRRYFVLNRSNAKVGLRVEDIAATVGLPIDITLPSSRQVTMALNEGNPIYLKNRRASFSKHVDKLIGQVNGVRREAK